MAYPTGCATRTLKYFSEFCARIRRLQRDTSNSPTGVANVVAPQWMRLTRIDNLITAAYSSGGQTWIDIGQDTLQIGTGPERVGLAVTSHDNNALATAIFRRTSYDGWPKHVTTRGHQVGDRPRSNSAIAPRM